MAITSRDIAREAGVSQSTVSRAMRGDPRVAPDTTQRVQDVARRLRYAPNAAARSLITSTTSTVAVMVANIKNPFYPQLVEALHDELSLSGYRTVLLNERSDVHSGEERVPQLHRGAIDGAVFVSVTIQSQLPGMLMASGLPVVLLNRDVDGLDADRVVSDNIAGAALAAEALVELGHRRIGIIAGPPAASTARDREIGFREGLARQGRALDERLHRASDFTHQGGYQWAMELLRQDPVPTAIFCANDVIAFGALDAAKRLGYRVPGDLSIIGYDDIEMAGWNTFGLTTIRQPLGEMAKSAARMLIERIETPSLAPRVQVFPADLIRRATTGPAPQA